MHAALSSRFEKKTRTSLNQAGHRGIGLTEVARFSPETVRLDGNSTTQIRNEMRRAFSNDRPAAQSKKGRWMKDLEKEAEGNGITDRGAGSNRCHASTRYTPGVRPPDHVSTLLWRHDPGIPRTEETRPCQAFHVCRVGRFDRPTERPTDRPTQRPTQRPPRFGVFRRERRIIYGNTRIAARISGGPFSAYFRRACPDVR
jgi:hypothetical protein